jgi:predicted phage tail protein
MAHQHIASMHRVHLWGSLRKEFGETFDLHVATVHEATRALSHMVKGFRATVAKGHFRIILGDRDTGRLAHESEVGSVLPVGMDVHIVPAVAGSGRGGGVGKIVVGIALAVASFYAGPAGWAMLGVTTAQGVATATAMGIGMGLSLAISGVSALVAPQPRTSTTTQQNSFSFSGAGNNAQQGGCVPVCYGEWLLGSVVVSQAISTQQLMN